MPPPSSASQARVRLPDRFKCRMCEAMKTPDNFSNRELNTFRYSVSTGNAVTAITARLRCRLCTGSQVHEMKCEGQCGLVRPLSDFSRSSRTSGSRWCQECVMWKESMEALSQDANTPAPPNFPLARDEPERWINAPRPAINPEEDDDFDDEETRRGNTSTVNSTTSSRIRPQNGGSSAPESVPYHSFAGLTLNSGGSNASSSQSPRPVPLHLRGQLVGSNDRQTQAQSSPLVSETPLNAPSTPRPGGVENDRASDSSVSNAFEGSSNNANTPDRNPWATIDARRRGNVAFTAYGPNGQVAQHYASQPPSSSSLNPQYGRRSGWARPARGGEGSIPLTPDVPEPPRRKIVNTGTWDSESDDEP